jgi:hypothetical protein
MVAALEHEVNAINVSDGSNVRISARPVPKPQVLLCEKLALSVCVVASTLPLLFLAVLRPSLGSFVLFVPFCGMIMLAATCFVTWRFVGFTA